MEYGFHEASSIDMMESFPPGIYRYGNPALLSICKHEDGTFSGGYKFAPELKLGKDPYINNVTYREVLLYIFNYFNE